LLDLPQVAPEREVDVYRDQVCTGLLVPTEGNLPPVPAAAYNVGAQLMAREAGVDDHPAMARVHLGDGAWLTLRAARIGERSPSEDADIAVTIERSRPGERLRVFARASGLSPRETELLQHLATGTDTRGVAQTMFVSEHTVQDHLKAIFEKTGTRSRRTLLATATGVDTD
jgi:DNA-binding NarL/FixJ family response regulator